MKNFRLDDDAHRILTEERNKLKTCGRDGANLSDAVRELKRRADEE